MSAKNVFTIPAGAAFAKALAARLMEETKGRPEALAEIRIFLPSRRACTVLKDSFLELSSGALLLPRMQPLGDIDGEELSLAIAGTGGQNSTLDVPPALSPMRRHILLARTIEKLPGFARGFDQALALADALARLMDQIHTEGLALENLEGLVPAEFSAHWQITIDFLKILSETWPAVLAEQGAIDAADRRNRLIRGLAAHWAQHPPAFPVIAAGSTGSIPATAALLSVIAAMDNGRVILPALDADMDDESWAALQESHPQYGLKHLLETMNMERGQVQQWPCEDNPVSQARRTLAREMMRPAETTGHWADLTTSAAAQKTFHAALQNLSLVECTNEREEAEAIAILLRGALEDPENTAALVTPDRNLARRVAVNCRRWGIYIDDSAGQSLDQSPHGVFLRLCLQAAIDNFSPVSLLSLLKHGFSSCGLDKAAFAAGVSNLEKIALRGPRPAPGINGILEKLKASKDESAVKAAAFLSTIAPFLQRFSHGSHPGKKHSFKDLLRDHLQMAEGLAAKDTLWSGESGETAAMLFAGLMDEGGMIPPITPKTYAGLIDAFMRQVTVRPAYGTHPRLKILGQLEARLGDAGLIILGGLNEGAWPQDAGFDPWMSRPMRGKFGLPPAERSTGLSAHDFVQGFCAQHVVVTRASRTGGTPAVPSRWLQRLETVLSAANLQKPSGHSVPAWVAALDRPDSVKSFPRPAPVPPLNLRPKKLSATRIEEWMRDPYSTYARYILNLKKLDPLEKAPDAADRGSLLHNILQQFVAAAPAEIPENAEEILHNIAAAELEKFHEDPAAWSFWWPRFARLASWLVAYETSWRKRARPVLAEIKGGMILDGFTLEARPDRIDKTPDGAVIIDYKSGGSFTKKGIGTGDKPQLALEALILKSGGFAGLPAQHTASLAYWLLTGGAEPGKIVQETSDIDSILKRTENGLKTLVKTFADETAPYYSLPRPVRAPAYNDYEHLARVKEWTALGDTDTEAA